MMLFTLFLTVMTTTEAFKFLGMFLGNTYSPWKYQQNIGTESQLGGQLGRIQISSGGCSRSSNALPKNILSMARSFKPTDRFTVKVKSKKTSKYSMPGYSKGDLDNLKLVFKLFCHTEKQIPLLSFHSLLNRSQEDAVRIWEEVSEASSVGSPEHSSNIMMKHLPILLSKLDKQSDKNELDSEKERLEWDLADLNHDLLETFFERNSIKNKLSFSDFITWENVRDEIWYNEKGINEKGVAEIWEKIAGCVSKEVNKDTFVKIYHAVCDISYEV